MELFASGNGGFKNVLYPDIETAHNLCQQHLHGFGASIGGEEPLGPGTETPPAPDPFDAELECLFAEFGDGTDSSETEEEGKPALAVSH